MWRATYTDYSGQRREEFKEVLKEERRADRGKCITQKMRSHTPEPEYASIEAFVAFMLEEADDNGKIPPFTVEQTDKISFRTRTSITKIVQILKDYGLTQAERMSDKTPRGYRSVENRWAGQSSSACSGQDSIIGFANSPKSKLIPGDHKKDTNVVTRGQNRNDFRLAAQKQIDEIYTGIGSVKTRIDMCMKFLLDVELYRKAFGGTNIIGMEKDIEKVKGILRNILNHKA